MTAARHCAYGSASRTARCSATCGTRSGTTSRMSCSPTTERGRGAARCSAMSDRATGTRSSATTRSARPEAGSGRSSPSTPRCIRGRTSPRRSRTICTSPARCRRRRPSGSISTPTSRTCATPTSIRWSRYRDEPVQRLLSDWEWMSQAFNRINRAMGSRRPLPVRARRPRATKARVRSRPGHPRPAHDGGAVRTRDAHGGGAGMTATGRGQQHGGHPRTSRTSRRGASTWTSTRSTARWSRRSDAFGAGWAAPELREIGQLVGGESFQRDAELANRTPAGGAHVRPLGAPARRGRIRPVVPPGHRCRSRSRRAHVGVGRSAARSHRGPRRDVHAVRPGRTGPRLPGVDDARGRARRSQDAPGWPPTGCRGCFSREYDPRRCRAPEKPSGAVRHGDDREAGRIGRAGQHHAGRAHEAASGLPAHRTQVVLLGADVGRLPRARADARRRQRRGAFVLLRPAHASGRDAQRLPHPAPQGQARQSRPTRRPRSSSTAPCGC